MDNKFLQPLLQAGLLDIGDSDEKLANIEKSIADVEAKLKKEQSLLPAYTLVAVDPNINPDEPVLAQGIYSHGSTPIGFSVIPDVLRKDQFLDALLSDIVAGIPL